MREKDPAPLPTTPPPEKYTRPIRSFVHRPGRMTVAQERYLAGMMPKIGIPYAPRPLDLNALYGRDAPKILEIGCGMGETTFSIALAHPENDYLGIEVYSAGIGSLCGKIAASGISNLRLAQHDAVEIVRDMLPPSSLSGIHIFFPDPWPKKRHHKRRLIQSGFAGELAQRLKPGAYLHCATDWEEYAAQMLEVLSAEPLLDNTAKDYALRPEYRPLTKFENRGLRLGHGVWDLIFRRKP